MCDRNEVIESLARGTTAIKKLEKLLARMDSVEREAIELLVTVIDSHLSVIEFNSKKIRKLEDLISKD